MAVKGQEQIVQVVAAIPSGHVVTYGQVAKMAGLGKSARLVGRVLKNLPKDTRLPWHRVLKAGGLVAFEPHSAPFNKQRQLLEAEGVLMLNGRVNLKTYGWNSEDV